MPRKAPASERFWEKVQRTDSCWLWVGAVSSTGYGSFNAGHSKFVGAHRFSYADLVAPIPEGMVLDHLCRVRHCVNPEHLEPVTHTENVRRGVGGSNHRDKTHCLSGHPFTPENTAIGTTPRGTPIRRCRECMRARDRARRPRKEAN